MFDMGRYITDGKGLSSNIRGFNFKIKKWKCELLMNKIFLVCGGVILLVISGAIFYVLDNYNKTTMSEIPEYSCYKLEFSQERFKPTSEIYKELVKEFEKRECERVYPSVEFD
jgi:hypothetical protein